MSAPRILVAGVGNIFRGDDGFGVEVAQQLTRRPLPEGVRVIDFGTRGHDLAYAILDGYDVVILVDAALRGGRPGSLYTMQPEPGTMHTRPGTLPTHGVDLPSVFQLVRLLGGTFPQLWLVGCEPADVGGEDEGMMGLSDPVRAAVAAAIGRVEQLIAEPARA